LADRVPNRCTSASHRQARIFSVRPFFSRALYFYPKVRFCGARRNHGFHDAEFGPFRNALPWGSEARELDSFR
jgi:hypothetical protein